MTRRCDCDACDSRNAAMPNKIITALSQHCRRHCGRRYCCAVAVKSVTDPLTLSRECTICCERERAAAATSESVATHRRCDCAATVAAGRKQMNERNKTTTTATRRCCACSMWCKSSAAKHKCGRVCVYLSPCACVRACAWSLSLSMCVSVCTYAGV